MSHVYGSENNPGSASTVCIFVACRSDHNKKHIVVERHVLSLALQITNVLANVFSHKAEDHDAMRHVEAAASTTTDEAHTSVSHHIAESQRNCHGSDHFRHVKSETVPFFTSHLQPPSCLTLNPHQVFLRDI